ncbi:MAG: hypothetical protein OK422_01140 [Thaumarchaeota archaeon]|nr:hypothetical protein [Nitrososphaerota archaeon]
MSKSRVTMRSSVENIEVGDFKIEKLNVGESAELPRWVAEELVHLNLAEMAEEPFETEIFKALSREKMLGPFQLSNMNSDFYLKMKRRLAYLRSAMDAGRVRKEDFERLRASSYDLIGLRLGKLLSLSSSSTSVATIGEKLTPEEKAFFTISQSASKEWKDALLGVGG